MIDIFVQTQQTLATIKTTITRTSTTLHYAVA